MQLMQLVLDMYDPCSVKHIGIKKTMLEILTILSPFG
jgi:hypothetical protein